MNHNHHGGHTGEPRILRRSFSDFLPLVIIGLAIIAWTVFRQWWYGAWQGDRAMMDFMAGFFLIFGTFKIANWRGFVRAYQMYDIVAMRSVAYAYAYPLVELGLGAAYLVRWNMPVVNGVTLIVMGVSSIGVVRKLLEREEIPCACLGAVFKIPMTWVTFAEDILMAAMALAMLVFFV